MFVCGLCAVSMFGLVTTTSFVAQPSNNYIEQRLQTLEQENLLLRQQYQLLSSQGTKLNALEKKIEAIENKETTVAFFAYLHNNLMSPPEGTTVVFGDVVTNIASNYDSSHGTFRAPMNGTYHFALTASSLSESNPNAIHVHMMKNSVPISYLYFDVREHNMEDWLQSTVTAVIHLTVSDNVWVEVTKIKGSPVLAGHGTTNMHSHFSGFLISAD